MIASSAGVDARSSRHCPLNRTPPALPSLALTTPARRHPHDHVDSFQKADDGDHAIIEKHLEQCVAAMKHYQNAKRKLRGAVDAVIGSHRMQLIVAAAHDHDGAPDDAAAPPLTAEEGALP